MHFCFLPLLKTTRSRQREQDKKSKELEPSKLISADQIMSSMPSLEQCAICMESLIKQKVGMPENCKHSFCLNCLIEWAKVKKNKCIIISIEKIFTFRKVIHVQLIV